MTSLIGPTAFSAIQNQTKKLLIPARLPAMGQLGPKRLFLIQAADITIWQTQAVIQIVAVSQSKTVLLFWRTNSAKPIIMTNRPTDENKYASKTSSHLFCKARFSFITRLSTRKVSALLPPFSVNH